MTASRVPAQAEVVEARRLIIPCRRRISCLLCRMPAYSDKVGIIGGLGTFLGSTGLLVEEEEEVVRRG